MQKNYWTPPFLKDPLFFPPLLSYGLSTLLPPLLAPLRKGVLHCNITNQTWPCLKLKKYFSSTYRNKCFAFF